MTNLHTKIGIACLLIVTFAEAQLPATRHPVSTSASVPRSSNVLRDLNSSLEAVVAKVSPAVVQIMVTGYGATEEQQGQHNTAVIVREHGIGSGVIVDPDGYIMTNAHVVEGAQRIRVILPSPPTDSTLEPQPIRAGQILEAKLVGTHKESDLALLKVEASHLPALDLGKANQIRQGQLVLAIGSPEGLRDSVTMGVVSSVSRQVDPDSAMVYIQTDAAMNPGNSGGPLVDIDGNVVGINTMMLSSGGGSEGLGFAIPAVIVNFDYWSLRSYGHVQRVAIGARAQNITPTMSEGLDLARSWGAIISDTTPGGMAEAAGLRVRDVVLAIDNHPILGLPDFMAALYLHPPDEVLKMDVLRDRSRMSFNIPVKVHHEKLDELSELPDLQKTLLRELDIFVADLDGSLKPVLASDRSESGIVVLAQVGGSRTVDTGLKSGDIIREIDRTPLQTVSQLQTIVRELKSGDAVVLQVERDGKLQYLAFEMD
jgi:serine protease Do